MSQENAKSWDAFEPPKYLISLIAAVNDGAKAAQAGALVFALVGVYLLATAFSASDEDLLRGRTVTISQIGATLPVSFSFAIAPFVFVFLHIYTLARYDMLAANVRQFLAELQTVPLEADRERCRLLLANVEFIQALVAPPGSRLYSPVWRWLVRALIAVFPVLVLLLVQINALRYQSELITRVQQLGVFLDLSALTWFFHRAPLERATPRPRGRMAEMRRWAKFLWLPVIVMGLNLVYLNVVPAGLDVRLVRRIEPAYLASALTQPLDLVLCPSLKWGCRYLRVDHRTLVDHVWDEKAMADLRRGGADQVKLAAIEGLVLRDRSLRFAVLDGSSLFAADLTGADLRAASLENAGLIGSKLSRTLLQGADLHDAQLQGADLSMQASYVSMQVSYGRPMLRLEPPAQLQGADLSDAQLQGTNLHDTELQGANLSRAQLQGADLSGAQLQGADLSFAQLQGAELSSANMQGADLTGVQLWRASFDTETNLELTDLRKADFTTGLTEDEIKVLHSAFDASRSGGRKAATDKRLAHLSAADQSEDKLRFTASPEHQVLVSDPKDPFLANIPTEWLITSPTPAYNDALVALLADELAARDPAIADRIAERAAWEIPLMRLKRRETIKPEDLDRFDYDAVACRLLANAGAEKITLQRPSFDFLSVTEAGKVKLQRRSFDLLSVQLREQNIECERTKPTAPH